MHARSENASHEHHGCYMASNLYEGGVNPSKVKKIAKRNIREIVRQVKGAKDEDQAVALVAELDGHFERLRQAETRRGDWVAV